LLLVIGILAFLYRRKQKRQAASTPAQAAQAAQASELPADDQHMAKSGYTAKTAELSNSADTGKYSTHPSAQRGVEYQEVEGRGMLNELP
jgi:hypothetical protein